MTVQDIQSFAAGQWLPSGAGARPVASAITGEIIGQADNDGLDVAAMLEYARSKGGPALRAMTFHARAKMIKALAMHLAEHGLGDVRALAAQRPSPSTRARTPQCARAC